MKSRMTFFIFFARQFLNKLLIEFLFLQAVNLKFIKKKNQQLTTSLINMFSIKQINKKK